MTMLLILTGTLQLTRTSWRVSLIQSRDIHNTDVNKTYQKDAMLYPPRAIEAASGATLAALMSN